MKYEDALIDVLKEAGVTKYRIDARGGKHQRIIYELDGRERFYVFPRSPSDTTRGIKNAVSDLRKHLGTRRPKVAHSPRNRAKKRAPKPPVELDTITVGKDPFEKLATLKGKPLPSRPGTNAMPPLWRRIIRAFKEGISR